MRRLFAAIALALGIAAPAAAFIFEVTDTGQPIFWPQLREATPRPLQFTYNANGSAKLGGPLGGNPALKLALDEAIGRWAQVPTSTVTFAPSVVSSHSRLAAEDSVNLVVFTSVNPQDFEGEDGPFIVGLTTTSFIPATGVLVDADMQFNDGLEGREPKFNMSLTGRTGTRENGKLVINLRDVVTHEMGHALGLDHSGVKGSSMYFAATDGATNLTGDDVAGISALYPSPSFRSTTGTISGRVTRTGSAVFGAHVVAVSIATGQPAVSGLSDPDGRYKLDGVPPGRYVVLAEGYRPNVAGAFYAGADPGVELNFHAPTASSPPTVVVVRPTLEVSGVDVKIEQRRIDPAGGTSLADAIPLPAGSAASRRLPPSSSAHPHDIYSFEASRGTTLTINLTAHRLWVPINARLEVLDAGLNVLAASADLSPNAPVDLDDRLAFAPSASGTQQYYLRVKAVAAPGDSFPDPRSVKDGESLYLLTTQSTRSNRAPRIVGSEAFSNVTTQEAGTDRGGPIVADLASAGADDEDPATALTWVASSVPHHLFSVDPAGLAARPPVLRIVPKAFRSGFGTFNLMLYDTDDAFTSVPVSVTIAAVNDPPKLRVDTSPALLKGGPRLVQLDAASSRAGPEGDSAEDAQGLTYAWTQVAGPAPLKVDGVSTPLLKALARDAGVYRFQLTGTENGASASGLQSSIVQDVTVDNLPPLAKVAAPPVAIPGQLVRVHAGLSSDPNEELTTGAFALTQLAPLDVTVPTTRTGTAAFAFVAPAQPGTYAFALTVTDSGFLELDGTRSNPLSDRTTFAVEVRAPDDLPPTADAGADRVASVSDIVTLDGRDSIGAAGEALVYAWRADTANPAPAEPAPADGATPAVTMPQVAGVYAYHLTVRGTRTGLTSPVATCKVRVIATSAGNRFAPVARARVLGGLGTGAVTPGDRVLLDATSSADPEGATLTFAWTQVDGPRVLLSSETGSTPSFVPPAPGLYRFKLVASDGALASRPVFAEIHVLPPGTAAAKVVVRAAHPAASVVRTPPEELRFTVDGSFSPSNRLELSAAVESGAPLRAVAWHQLGGPRLPYDVSEDGSVLTIIPRQARVHTFRAVALLTDGQVCDKTVHLLVDRPNSRIPRATLMERPALDVVTGSEVELDGSASRDVLDTGDEQESASLVYYWEQEDGPPVPMASPTAAHPVFKPPMPGRYAFRLRVDNQRFGTLSAPSAAALVAEVREPAPVPVNNLTDSPPASSGGTGGGRGGGCALARGPRGGEVDLTPLAWLMVLAMASRLGYAGREHGQGHPRRPRGGLGGRRR